MAGATQVSLKGAGQILAEEGLVLGGYLDSVNVWTIGVGHTAAAGGVNPADYAKKKMSKRDAMLLFLSVDLPRYAADVLRAVKVPLAQHELDALASFHYNTGAIARAGITKKLNAGDRAGAAEAFKQWVKPASITQRRMNEMHLFATGQYRNSGYVAVYPGGAGGGRGNSKPESIASLLALVTGEAADATPQPEATPIPNFLPPKVGDDPTPEPPLVQATTTTVDPVLARVNRIKAVQRDLFRVGLHPGDIDGDIGPNMKGAMINFRTKFNLAGDPEDIDELLESKLRETPDGYFKPKADRALATPEQAAQKSETVEKISFLSKIKSRALEIKATVLGILGIDASTDIFGFFSGRWSMVTSKLSMVPIWVWFALAAAGYLVWRHYETKTKEVAVEAFKRGDIIGGDKAPPGPPTNPPLVP